MSYRVRTDNRPPPSLSRVTPSAASEHVSELLGCPISRSRTACCVCLELRPLPSTDITRLQRYCEPLRHPNAPGLSLTGVRLIIPDHASGLPVLRALSLCKCCRHYPGAAAERSLRSCHPTVSAFSGSTSGSAYTSSFSRSHGVFGGSDRFPGKVRGLLPPPILQLTMNVTADQPEAPTAIRTDLGAIFVSLELSRSSWLITSLSPGGGERHKPLCRRRRRCCST